MLNDELNDPFSKTNRQRVNHNDECLHTSRSHGCEGAVELIRLTYRLKVKRNPQLFGSSSQNSHVVRAWRVHRIPQKGHTSYVWNHLPQQFKPLAAELVAE